MNIIETQNLTKTYGDFTAVSHPCVNLLATLHLPYI